MTEARQHLARLESMRHQIEHAERNILDRAQAALKRTQEDIERLRPLALVPGAAEADEYQQAIHDRGRLQIVIAQARKVLGE